MYQMGSDLSDWDLSRDNIGDATYQGQFNNNGNNS